MKFFTSLFFVFIFTLSFSQKNDFIVLLDSAKAEFKTDFEHQNFSIAVRCLEKAVKINPNDVEAKYFLGYAYSRLNSKDASDISNLKINLIIKASEEFEKINKISPKYEGEIISQGPYSKITSEWGFLALHYLYLNKKDSAKWAFKEGRLRGGFNDYHLSVCKEILDTCNKNAFLISSGDSYLFPFLYLQNIEKYREDISVIDINLLNAFWYSKYLRKNQSIIFDLPPETLDTIKYQSWQDTIITISDFSWTVKPSNNGYINRGDVVFLSLLKANEFKRDIYFTKGFAKSSQLSLAELLTSQVIVDKLIVSEESKKTKEYKDVISNILGLSDLVNKNNEDDIYLLNTFRIDVIIKAFEFINDKNFLKAKELMELIDKYANENDFPYQNQRLNMVSDYIRETLKNNNY